MWLIDRLAERRIREARERGELDDLPGAGRPLPPDEVDPLVPEELRAGLRLLKNAGYLPPGARLLGEVREVEQLILQARTAEEREHLSRRLRLLQARLGDGRGGNLLDQEAYRQRLLQRMEKKTP